MTPLRQLGIWMDHVQAKLYDISGGEVKKSEIFRADPREDHNIPKGEYHENLKSDQLQKKFYQEIAHIIKGYHEVLIFGPTGAKVELIHQIQQNSLCPGVKLNEKSAGKMTENEQIAFILDHFKS